MRFFLDTANVEDIRKANDMGVICGVTTNPSLIAKEDREIAAIHPNMVVNIPMTVEGLKAVKVLAKEGNKFISRCALPLQLNSNTNQPYIHILDCTKVLVYLDNSNYENSSISRYTRTWLKEKPISDETFPVPYLPGCHGQGYLLFSLFPHRIGRYMSPHPALYKLALFFKSLVNA